MLGSTPYRCLRPSLAVVKEDRSERTVDWPLLYVTGILSKENCVYRYHVAAWTQAKWFKQVGSKNL